MDGMPKEAVQGSAMVVISMHWSNICDHDVIGASTESIAYVSSKYFKMKWSIDENSEYVCCELWL